jgi:3-methyladenine DNA glycosylase/8-oxoguanine DNA glycosylase
MTNVDHLTLELRGAGGEPIDLRRTLFSHGLVELPPMNVAEDASWLEVTIPLTRGRPRTVRVEPAGKRTALMTVMGRRASEKVAGEIGRRVAHILRLDEDLSEFYSLAKNDPQLAWVNAGAGRLIRSATAFEEVVKTICTTNCSWGATKKMVSALVQHLGEPANGAANESPLGRAFPTPQAMASVNEKFYKEVVRAGYRSAYLLTLARDVAEGDIDLEGLATVSSEELPDTELAERLLALPGVGPYAAAHIMMMMGRYSALILDSWTRPKYARLMGKKSVADATIVRRFRHYGRWAGLAFWLFVTRDWIEDPISIR